MISAKTWEKFLLRINKKSDLNGETAIYPILCTDDRNKIQPILQECQNKCCDLLGTTPNNHELSENYGIIKKALQDTDMTEDEWGTFWEKLICGKIANASDWDELSRHLGKQRVIFIFDGLENVFDDLVGNDSQKRAIRGLCKNAVTRIYETQIDNIGIIIFLRKDMAELAINTNFEQFRNMYKPYELNWTKKDALQLAWKLSSKAAENSNINGIIDNVPSMNVSQSVLEDNLSQIWGKKMGGINSKTAYTVRWVIASLSDFNGQLQARDIVRFLMEASSDKMRGKGVYEERFLSPDDLKYAIKHSSEKKLQEVEQEIHQLKEIFKTLREVPMDDKQVPLNENVMRKLGVDDRKTLEMYGYLKEADREFYIPENIRYALGYNKSRRGGIKLVSLLVD